MCDNFIVVSNRRVATVKEKKKDENGNETGKTVEEQVHIATVDVHHFFAATLKKGKKNDHAMHIVCLDAIIKKI